MSKIISKIELSKEEDAVIYYEKTLGKNISIRKRANVIYYASQENTTIAKLSKETGYSRVFIENTLEGYEEQGIDYIYDCSRGIKKSVLDEVETELIEEFEKFPPSSVPEAVSRIKEKFGITLTETPVRNWLKKTGFVTSSQEQYLQKQILKHSFIS